jgi:hypothetical protein
MQLPSNLANCYSVWEKCTAFIFRKEGSDFLQNTDINQMTEKAVIFEATVTL